MPPSHKGKKPGRHQEMDELCKSAMEKDGGRLLALVFTKAVCRRLGLPHAAPRLLEILPTELRRKRQYADYLIKVEIGDKLVLLHIEFQNKPDPKMALRIAQYQVAVYERYELPVHSVVFNVHGQNDRAVRVTGLSAGGLRSHWVEVTVPNMLKAGPDILRTASPLAVLLGVLLGDAGDREIEQCLRRLGQIGLDERTCRELVEALCFLLDLERKDVPGETHKRLIMKLRMEQTWLFKEGRETGLEEGREEGLKKGMKKGMKKGREEGREIAVKTMQAEAVKLCQKRFGKDVRGVSRIKKIKEPSLLSRLIVQLATARSLADAFKALPAT